MLGLRVLEARVSRVSGCLGTLSFFFQNLGKADLLGGKPDAFVDVALAPGTHKEIKTKFVLTYLKF